MIKEILDLKSAYSFYLPLYASRVSAGFPSPADDYVDDKIDLNQQLIENPSATFFVRVQGDSMSGAGINNDDVLIVDKSLEAKNRSIVLAVINGEMTVKRLFKNSFSLTLYPENKKYKPIKVTEEMDFEVWGVVTYVIHSTK